MIQINQLSRAYRGKTALNALDLELPAGRLVGLLGPNGSGKTTLLKILAGLDAAYTGEVLINGVKPGLLSKQVVAFLPERPVLNEQSRIEAVIEYHRDFFADFDPAKARHMLQYFQIEPGRKLKELSKGMREKVQISMVLARKAQVYLLDEPISGVDPASRSVILEGMIRNFAEDALVLLSTHLIGDVEVILDDVVFLNHGQVVLQGPADELRSKHQQSIDQLFREVFKCSVFS